MFDKVRQDLAKKADELDGKVDAQRQEPFFVSDGVVAVQMPVGRIKQALNTVSDYNGKGYRIAGIVEQEAIHASLIIMEKA